MMLLIIIILCVLSICIERAYKKGLGRGRCEIIEENLVRLKYKASLEDAHSAC